MGAAMHILLAIDGSELSRHAVDYVVKHRETLGRGATITCVFIEAPPVLRAIGAFGADPGMPPVAPIDPQKLVGPHIHALEAAGYKPTLEIREGDPGVEIANAAADGQCDLIVMGTHGRRLLSRALLGSVANTVLSSGTIPVLLVR
jgi:nucleotide-binding universal stress UspA family protein